MIFQTAPVPLDLFRIISDTGLVVLLLIIVWGAIKEWWVPGPTHRRMVAERDQLLKLALKGTNVTARTLKAAETFVDGPGDETP